MAASWRLFVLLHLQCEGANQHHPQSKLGFVYSIHYSWYKRFHAQDSSADVDHWNTSRSTSYLPGMETPANSITSNFLTINVGKYFSRDFFTWKYGLKNKRQNTYWEEKPDNKQFNLHLIH